MNALLALFLALLLPCSAWALSSDEIVRALLDPVNSSGNVADAVDEATGARGWMSSDMKPIIGGKIVGRAATALMRPGLRNDSRNYRNHLLEVLDEAEPGSILVFVMQDGLEIAAMGNLMATTAKVRGLAGAVIDGAVRDIAEIRQIGLPVWSRRVSPATSIGRMVSVDKQVAVQCGGVAVAPGDYIVADADGVVVVPQAAAGRVIELLAQYADKESRMIPIIQEHKSMLKALEIYKRY
ncbi:MAG: RraA family protein [Betaproteobacteria bacterium]|jgi:regulator of RNase E activity RraA